MQFNSSDIIHLSPLKLDSLSYYGMYNVHITKDFGPESVLKCEQVFIFKLGRKTIQRWI